MIRKIFVFMCCLLVLIINKGISQGKDSITTDWKVQMGTDGRVIILPINGKIIEASDGNVKLSLITIYNLINSN